VDAQAAADRIGWAWVIVASVAAPWLGQGGEPCPAYVPPPGVACLEVPYGPDFSLLYVAFLGAVGLSLDQQGDLRRLSGVTLLIAGPLAGAWAATHQFLGSAFYAPRLPLVVLLTLPPLAVAVERFTRRTRSHPRPGRGYPRYGSQGS
jgi:hypothetical protein